MQQTSLYHKTIPAMNSCIDLVITGVEAAIAEKVCSAVEQECILLEKLLSCYDPEAEIFQINEKAYWQKVTVSDRLWNILMECYQYNNVTCGYFDIGLKNFKRSIVRQQHNCAYGLKSTALNPIDRTVTFGSADTAFDFGGIGKGLLLREAEKILHRYEVMNCFISFGGSSILTRGRHPYGTNWPLTLRGHWKNSYTFYLNNHSASFSGAFQESAGSKIYHIVNPRNLTLEKNNRIAYVQCQCPVAAEVLSTTLVLADMEETGLVVERFAPLKAFVFDIDENQELSVIYSYEQDK